MSIIELRGGILQEIAQNEEEQFLKALFELLKKRNRSANERAGEATTLSELIQFFIKNAPKNVEISDAEIIDELMAHRYGLAA